MGTREWKMSDRGNVVRLHTFQICASSCLVTAAVMRVERSMMRRCMNGFKARLINARVVGVRVVGFFAYHCVPFFGNFGFQLVDCSFRVYSVMFLHTHA